MSFLTLRGKNPQKDFLSCSMDSSALIRRSSVFVQKSHEWDRKVQDVLRKSSAYLTRRSIVHSRWKPRLDDHIELLRCYYNFMRPHRALKFGKEIRTPAMQAGLVGKKLSFRDVFTTGFVLLSSSIRVLQVFALRNCGGARLVA